MNHLFLNFHNPSASICNIRLAVSLRSQALFVAYVLSEYKSTLYDHSIPCTECTVMYIKL